MWLTFAVYHSSTKYENGTKEDRCTTKSRLPCGACPSWCFWPMRTMRDPNVVHVRVHYQTSGFIRRLAAPCKACERRKALLRILESMPFHKRTSHESNWKDAWRVSIGKVPPHAEPTVAAIVSAKPVVVRTRWKSTLSISLNVEVFSRHAPFDRRNRQKECWERWRWNVFAILCVVPSKTYERWCTFLLQEAGTKEVPVMGDWRAVLGSPDHLTFSDGSLWVLYSRQEHFD